ncbi:50S ribosomal protein L5 [Candidatus Parcubacteria bacterium]|nr:MAG: 50S ribosomal protein L5 [Candidatus Parcubacteria bacterium]
MNATVAQQKKTFDALKGELGFKNVMQAPKVAKIILSTGVGSIKDKKRLDFIEGRLATIAGQAPAKRGAKKSIANFKIRTGDAAGFQITLRGSRAASFLDKLIHIVFPRVKDFRGIKQTAIDEMGNISIGLREHTVFPETADEDARDVFGVSITIVTTAKSKKEAERFLRHIGLPLQENK